MGRNNERNIKEHNDKLHKERRKSKGCQRTAQRKVETNREKIQWRQVFRKQLIMDKSQFEELRNGVQEIIDFIAAKDNRSANNKLLEVSEKLDDFLDKLPRKTKIWLKSANTKCWSINCFKKSIPKKKVNNLGLCFCGSESTFRDCCQKYIDGIEKAPTALPWWNPDILPMPATKRIIYWIQPTVPKENTILKPIFWIVISNQWQNWEIISFTENTVEFKAYFLDANKIVGVHHRYTDFQTRKRQLVYVDGKFPG